MFWLGILKFQWNINHFSMQWSEHFVKKVEIFCKSLCLYTSKLVKGKNCVIRYVSTTYLGNRFLMSQKTARPRLTSCFISLILASRGQHFLLLYPTMFSLFGSGCSVKYLWIKSRASSAVNRKNMWIRSTYREYNRMGCEISVSTSWKHKKSLGIWGGPDISAARFKPKMRRS